MEHLSDEQLSDELSRCLFHWQGTGKEEKYARSVLREYVKRVQRKCERRKFGVDTLNIFPQA